MKSKMLAELQRIPSNMLLLLLASISLAVCAGGKVQLPSFLEKCSKSDPDCFTRNLLTSFEQFKHGDAKLGVPAGEPVHFELLDVEGQSTGPVSLRQKYTNVYFYGSTILTLANMTVDFTGTNCFWSWTSHADNYTMIADYEITGQFLVLPINGHGKCRNVMLGVDCFYKLPCERYTKKGKTHIRFTDIDFDVTHVDEVRFNLTNLIEGNEQLSEELLKTINENGVLVFNEAKGGVNRALIKFWKTVMNKFFARFPEDELFKD